MIEWRNAAPTPVDGLSLLSPADQQEEAAAIALVLRDALETPGARAALVTPDRDLAGRVADRTAALRRGGRRQRRREARRYAAGGVPAPAGPGSRRGTGAGSAAGAAEASAGRRRASPGRLPRRRTGAGTGLPARSTPEPWCGRSATRTGPSGAPTRTRWCLLRRLEACLEPTLRIDSSVEIAPAEALAALIEAAERLAATDELPGPSRLWAGEEGDALATSAGRSAGGAATAAGPAPHRAARAAGCGAGGRGRAQPPGTARPRRDRASARVHLGSAGGTAADRRCHGAGRACEGVWPPASDPGPWLSRPMRATVGLPSPEEIVGQAAHDFVACACCGADRGAVLPAPRDGAPAVPARWLTRLEMLLAGQGDGSAGAPAACLGAHAGPAGRWAAPGPPASAMPAGRICGPAG